MIEKIIVYNLEPSSTIHSKNKKEIFFDEWKGSKKNIEAFYEMEKYEEENKFIESSIDSILIRQLMSYIIPIIEFIPASLRQMSRNPAKVIEPQKSVKNGIIFKVDYDTKCLFNGEFIMVSKFSTINIIGFRLNHKKCNSLSSKEYAEFYFSNNIKKTLNNLIDLVKSINDHHIYRFNLKPKVERVEKIPLVHPKCSNIIIKLNKILDIDLCHAYHDVTVLNIFNTKNYTYYNKLELTNSSDIFDIIKYEHKIDKFKSVQESIYDKIRYEMYRKQNIAVKKFKTSDLSKLSKNQLAILEKEYSLPVGMEAANALYKAMDENDIPEIKKNLKKVSGVCEHNIFKANLLLEKYNSVAEKNQKIRNRLTQFIDNTISDSCYYCRICGEELYKIDNMTQVAPSNKEYSNYNYDAIYILIYKEVLYIANNFVEFGNTHKLSIYSIIHNTTDLIKNEILSIESNLIKIKTLGKEDIKVIISIYIYIYTFAILSNLIFMNKFIKFKKSLFELNRSPYIKVGSRSATKNTKALQLQKICSDAINILKDVKYKDLQNSKIIEISMLKAKFFEILRWVMSISNETLQYSSESYWESNNPIIEYLSVESLGRSVKTIEKELQTTGIYDTIVKPTISTKDVYKRDSLLSLYTYINEKLYLQNNKIHNFYEKYTHLETLEKEEILRNKLMALNPQYSIPYIHYKNNIQKSKLNHKQDSDIFIYKKGNTTKELTIKEIKKWLDDKDYKKVAEFNSWVLVEVKPSKENKLTESQVDMLPFYKFYEIKCPLGDLHDFDAMVKCTKCNITEEFMQKLDKAYYNKYISYYKDVRKKEYESQSKLFKSVKPVVEKTFPKWVLNNTLIIKLTDLIKKSPNIVYNFGLSENNEYIETKFEKINLTTLSIEETIKRNNNLYDYYLFTIRNYYLLRSSEYILDLPIYLKPLLNKFSNTNLSKKLPIINKDFIEMYKYYKKHIQPVLLTNFLLTSIADTLLKIFDAFTLISLKPMGLEFVKILFNRLIAFEKKMSKFDIQKILRKINFEKITITDMDDFAAPHVDEIDPNIDELNEKIAEDYIVIDDEYGDFSMSNIDIDYENVDNWYKDVADKLS